MIVLCEINGWDPIFVSWNQRPSETQNLTYASNMVRLQKDQRHYKRSRNGNNNKMDGEGIYYNVDGKE